MNRHVFLLLYSSVIILSCLSMDDQSNKCFDQEYISLCFCRSSSPMDFFLAQGLLAECDHAFPIRQCHENQFHPPSFHLTQLIPKLTNFSHCLNNSHCLHALPSVQHCPRCRLTYNDSSSSISMTDHLAMDACFYLCQQDTSCGFLCLERLRTISVHCQRCRGQRQSMTCRCVRNKQSSICEPTSTPRWMQKRGFPAAAILGLLIFAVILLIVALKLIYCQLDLFERRRNGSLHRSRTPTVSHQPSPSLPANHSQQQLLLLPIQSEQLVVEIHRCIEETELSILLLKNVSRD